MAGPIRIALLANGRQARAEIDRTAGSLGVIGKSASRAGKLIAGAFAIGAIIRAGEAIGRTGSQYVSSLNKIQALTGSTDQQMGQIADRLEAQSSAFAKFGQTTGDAAQGMVELAKSGLSAHKALGAIRGTMTLAKAGELDVAQASETVANALNVFNLKASKASKVANSLANAANISSSDVSDLAESFKYAAPVAAKAGASLDQVSALLAELANAGIKGSQAGTTLRSMFVRLQAPTTAANMTLDDLGVKIFDAGGKMRDFRDIIAELGPAIDKLTGQDKAYALKNLFGLNAITGAQEILARGAKTFDEYSKGVKRAGAATKLAESASKGLAGTFASIKASATSTVQELYRRYSPAVDNALRGTIGYLQDHRQAFEDLAHSAVPALKAVSDMATSHLLPALKSIGTLAVHTAEALGSGDGGLAKTLAKDLLDALGKLADIVKSAADGLDRLPGPIKSIAAEAAIAALVFPRLAAGVTAASTSMRNAITYTRVLALEMRDAETRGRNLSTAMSQMGSAARAAAGVGGMVALMQSTKETNQTLAGFEKIAGGALTGLAVGGPWGAAIGGGVGLLVHLKSALRSSGDEAIRQQEKIARTAALEKAKQAADELRGALDQLTGAYTKDARAVLFHQLAQQQAITAGSKLGLSARTLVNALLGQKDAQEQVTAATEKADRIWARVGGGHGTIQGQAFALSTLTDRQKAYIDASTALKGAMGTIDNEHKHLARSIRNEAAATASLTELFPRLTKPQIVKIRSLGTEATRRQVNDVAKQLKLTDREHRVLLRVAGFNGARKSIDQVNKQLKDTGKAKPNMAPWLHDLIYGTNQGKRAAEKGSKATQKALEQWTGKAKWDATPFTNSIRSGTEHAASVARSTAPSVGSNLKSGILIGFQGTAAALAAAAASAVRQAVAAAKHAGEIHSPSRLTRREVGKPLAQGITLGFIDGVREGSSGISKVLDRLTAMIEKKYDGKKQAARRKSLLKSLKDERAALVANGRQQDKNDKLLDKAIEKYKQLKQRANEFADSIRSGFQSYGSIVGLGTTGGGSAVTLPALLSQLQARATIAQQFSTVIKSLRDKLNKTSLRQLLEQAAGGDLEGALATAQAISSGGASAITQINHLTQQISQAGADLGEKMRQKFFGHGLEVAQGVVNGLERRRKQLDRIADRLAQQFVKQAGLQIKASGGGISVGQTHSNSRAAASAGDTFSTRTATAPAASVKITLSAEQVSQLQRGREIQADLDVYHGAGGRAKVRTK